MKQFNKGLLATSSKLILGFAVGCYSALTFATPLNVENSVKKPAEIVEQQKLMTVTKQQLLYGYEEMLSFDVKEYLQQNSPHLVDYAEVISHYAGYSSISPKLLISLIEQQTGLISAPGTDEQLQKPFATLSSKTGFAEQVEEISEKLASSFYQGHSFKVTGKNEKLTTDADAIRAINQLFSKQEKSTNNLAAVEQINQSKMIGLITQYNLLFNAINTETERNALRQQTSNDVNDLDSYFQLPFPEGDYWKNGGSHGNSGSGSYPQSSLDFNQGGYWGDNLSYIWVSAAAPGTVKYHSSCLMEVIHQDGWSTTYYHLSNIQYGTGAYVERNTPIANYASNKSQALCNGGASTGPHLHFSMKKNGQYYHLNGMKFSDYKVKTGRNSYDENCNYFWLEKNSRRYCAWSNIYNSGVSETTPPDNSVIYTGYLANRASQIQPNGSWFYYNGGAIKASLSGPSSADFELRLERWNGYQWYSVATSTTPSSTELINYSANSGYYRVIVYSYSGYGNYTLSLSK